MRTIGALLFLLGAHLGALQAGSASAQGVEPAPPARVVVRTRLDPASGAVIGEPVKLLVDVLFPEVMIRPPRVAVSDPPGAQIMRFEDQGTTMRERIGTTTYVGQEFTFVLLPRRAGEIAVPAPEITLLDRSGAAIGAATGAATTLDVVVPPGIDASGPVIASTHVTASQSWSPTPAAARTPGAAIVRTIIREARDVPALGMAEFVFAAPQGVSVYVDPPVSDDRVDRGALTGRRTDRATYVFERAGAFDLPALSQSWWDLASRSVRSEDLPGATVTIAPGPTAAAPPPSQHPLRRWAVIAAGTAATALAMALIYGVGRRLAPRWAARAQAHRSSERAARQNLLRAAKSGDAAQTYRLFSIWSERLEPAERAATQADGRLASSVADLSRFLFGDGGSWSLDQGNALAGALRSVCGDRHRAANVTERAALPPLNPL